MLEKTMSLSQNNGCQWQHVILCLALSLTSRKTDPGGKLLFLKRLEFPALFSIACPAQQLILLGYMPRFASSV